MLSKLSYRNARRQAKDYLLFFITMTIAAAILYSFNSLMFSVMFTQLEEMLSESGGSEGTLTIVFYSVLMVLVVGWLVSYMMNFMLQLRSQELGTYMLLGIEKEQIARMFVQENCIVGLAALLLGILTGAVMSELLQAMLISLYSGGYAFSVRISFGAAGLTILYFGLIYAVALIFSRRKLKNMRLVNLLYYDRKNEYPHVGSRNVGILLLICSILCGISGIAIVLIQPWGSYMDLFAGFAFIIICLFCFYIGFAPVIYDRLEHNKKWKYQHTNMFIYRIFTAKLRKMSVSLGFIAVLFTAAMFMFGAGAAYGIAVNQLTELEQFDLTILHMDEEYDFMEYRDYLSATTDVEASHGYTLYTQQESSLMEMRNAVLDEYFAKRGITATAGEYLYSENQYDTYMKYSDYTVLREMLGLEPAEMGENEFIIHCMPYLQSQFEQYTGRSDGMEISGKNLDCAGIYTENFSQYDGYGNGQEFIIIIPDEAAADMTPLYSLYAANLDTSVDLDYLNGFINSFSPLGMMDVNFIEGETDGETGTNSMTRLLSGHEDYLGGRYVIFAARAEIMLIVSLIYVGIILFMVGSVLLAVQLLSDNKKNRHRYSIANMLGMESRRQERMLAKQVALYFSLSFLPVMALSAAIVYIIADLILKEYFLVPVFASTASAIAIIFLMTILVFLVIYFIYGFMSYSTMKRNVLV